ncbi:hypothetical protein LY04_00004 [Oceanimonas baumannii]|uniref:Transposase n=1 Tax=Oceanimonas baumannii TaxID=129578 RepID=A0ABY2F1Z4_9GAMM|nr:hypothetical protein LY04_00004 [Oceanimonas baumannii]
MEHGWHNKEMLSDLDLTRFNGHTSITQRGEPCQLTKRESEPSSTATTSR